MEPDADLLQIFRDETHERVDRIVDVLLAVESHAAPAGAIDSLFRDAHSIKGNAGMMGFEEAQRLAHAMEDALEESRRDGALAPGLPAALLEATDAIRRVVDGEAEPPGAGDALGRLREATPPITPAKAGSVPAPAAPPAPTNGVPANPLRAPEVPPSDAPSPGVRSLRVDAEKVDRLLDVVGETVLHRRRLDHLVVDDARRESRTVDDEAGRGGRLLDELQDAVLHLRALPLSSVTGRYPRAVRDLARAEGKAVSLELAGAETRLDRVILDGISETIVHLLRNAISHGVEPPDERERAGKPVTARIELRAEPRGDLVAITVADDGRGVSAELARRGAARGSLAEVLAEAGVSTAGEVTELSGRGVGLDAVKRHVESLGGSLDVESEPGRGTRTTLLLPLTLALLHLVLVERGGQVFGVPLATVTEVVAVTQELALGERRSIEVRDASVAVTDLVEVLGAAAAPARSVPPALVVTSSGRRVALVCDAVLGEQEVLVKSLGPLLAGVPGYLGAAILVDGRIALILDPAFVCRAPGRRRPPVPDNGARPAAVTESSDRPAPAVLVVDDQFTVRELQRSILEAAGYRVTTAGDGAEALRWLRERPDIALVVTDIEMPEMDGLDLLRAIRARPEGSSLPVVVVTSRGSDEDRARGGEAGADAYIVKAEFDQESLLDTVARLIRTP